MSVSGAFDRSHRWLSSLDVVENAATDPIADEIDTPGFGGVRRSGMERQISCCIQPVTKTMMGWRHRDAVDIHVLAVEVLENKGEDTEVL